MDSWHALLMIHLFGLALAVGAATVKLVLALSCRNRPELLPVFAQVTGPASRLIALGMVLLALSGFGWILLGAASLTPLLGLKIALVVAIFAIGPYIDRAVEPKLARLAALTAERSAPELARVQRLHLALESVATALLYLVVVVGVLV